MGCTQANDSKTSAIKQSTVETISYKQQSKTQAQVLAQQAQDSSPSHSRV
jgi:hypothetical protein